MVVQILVLVFSVVVHEVAHGWTALQLGDPTAQEHGRLTLNPIPHIDPLGSIVLPLIMASTMGFMFGWAKPVPVHPGRLNNPRDDHPKVAAAGPASNLLLALGFAILLGITLAVGSHDAWASGERQGPSAARFLATICFSGIQINVILAMFNLVPVPPLDGSWILSRFLPAAARANYENLRRRGMLLFLGFILVLNFTPVGSLFWGAREAAANQFLRLAETVAGLFGAS